MHVLPDSKPPDELIDFLEENCNLNQAPVNELNFSNDRKSKCLFGVLFEIEQHVH